MTVVVIPLAYYSYARWRGVGATTIVEDTTETTGR
jgi:hypothetical protein